MANGDCTNKRNCGTIRMSSYSYLNDACTIQQKPWMVSSIYCMARSSCEFLFQKLSFYLVILPSALDLANHRLPLQPKWLSVYNIVKVLSFYSVDDRTASVTHGKRTIKVDTYSNLPRKSLSTP